MEIRLVTVLVAMATPSTPDMPPQSKEGNLILTQSKLIKSFSTSLDE